MGLMDAIGTETTITLKVSELSGILRAESENYAYNKCLINGLKGSVDPKDILIMIGENVEVD